MDRGEEDVITSKFERLETKLDIEFVNIPIAHDGVCCIDYRNFCCCYENATV